MTARVRRGWALGVVVLLACLVGGVTSLAGYFGAAAWVRHTDNVRVKVALARADLQDAETAARGYLVTGERRFLGPFDRALEAWSVDLADLKTLTRDNAGQQVRLQSLDEIGALELANVKGMVAARDAGASGATLLSGLDGSKAHVEDARALLADMEHEEARLDVERGREATRRSQWTMAFFGSGVAASLLVIAALGKQRRTSEARRRGDDDERRLLEDVFAGIEDGITLQDRSGKLIFANARAARVIGFDSVEALLSASIVEIMERFELLDENGQPFPIERLPSRAVLAGGTAPETIVRYRMAGTGEERWAVTRAFPVRDEAGTVVRAVNVFRDVTAEQKADTRRQFLLRAVDELSSSLDYETTLAAVARLAVPVLADWCGVDIVEDVGLKRLATAHVDPAKVARAEELGRRYPADPASRTGTHEIVRTGKALLLPTIPRELLRAAAVDAEHLALIEALNLSSYMAVPLAIGERVLGVITFAMAESGRVYTEEDLGFAHALADRAALAIENARLFRAVEQAGVATTNQLIAEEQRRREAEEQTRFAETFVGMLGHDLRNPLNAIIMNARLMLKRATGDPKAIARIETSARRMTNMVAQLLDLTRSRIAGGITADRKPVELGALVSEVVDEMTRTYPGREILWAPAEVPAFADRDRLAQVVSNLLGNALEHGDPQRPVTVRLAATPTGATLTVHNDGPPIPSELMPMLFEPFRSTMARGERSKGLGLGLFITQQIVLVHGGRVEVTSDAQRGTTFEVVLPGVSGEIVALPANELVSRGHGSSALDGVGRRRREGLAGHAARPPRARGLQGPNGRQRS